PLATIRYKTKTSDDKELMDRMQEIGKKYPRYGHRRMHSQLRKEGFMAGVAPRKSGHIIQPV
ncbi:MAG: IS3 family transposase, partial [Pseudomonadota bacterium]|nr:IS3 family transposase [Pseudomonadota bacterium]